MRTTLDVEDRLLRDAKRRAVEDGRTLTAVIEAALRQYLAPAERPRTAFRLRLLTKKGRQFPGVDLSDRDSLYDRMEGRR
jgi:Bacterial antitoxin of type II TA system, VapB